MFVALGAVYADRVGEIPGRPPEATAVAGVPGVGILSVEPDAAGVGADKDAPAAGQHERKTADARQHLDVAVGGRLAGEPVGTQPTYGAAADKRRVVVRERAVVLLPADAETDSEALAGQPERRGRGAPNHGVLVDEVPEARIVRRIDVERVAGPDRGGPPTQGVIGCIAATGSRVFRLNPAIQPTWAMLSTP